jgi:hypothetical protein
MPVAMAGGRWGRSAHCHSCHAVMVALTQIDLDSEWAFAVGLSALRAAAAAAAARAFAEGRSSRPRANLAAAAAEPGGLGRCRPAADVRRLPHSRGPAPQQLGPRCCATAEAQMLPWLACH